MNRDTELLKVQVLADYYHNLFILFFSSILAFFVGFAIALFTLQAEGSISLFVYYFSLFLIAIPFVYLLLKTAKRYSENLDKIDGLLRQIENGEPLPSLKELKGK